MLKTKLNSLFKWKPYTEQDLCERRLREVMKRLNIDEFNYNWDRSSCYIEFRYQEQVYKMEHTVQKAKEKGVIVLRNGLDCLMQLVESLEDLCSIIERGTYKLETWVAGMKQPSEKEKVSKYKEEVHISYKYNGNEEFPSELGEFDRKPLLQR